MLNQEATARVSKIVMGKLSKREQTELIDKLAHFNEFRQGEITLDKLDEILLFTGNKVKEGMYQLEEAMYEGQNVVFERQCNGKSIRQLIEVNRKPLYNF